MDIYQFNKLIVVPVLKEMGYYSKAANVLVLGTALVESNLKYIEQLHNGIAKGFYQIEPETAEDIWENFLKFRIGLANKVSLYLLGDRSRTEQLVGNMYYGTAMCRVHYLRVPSALPDWADPHGMAVYWKEHYNTVLGAGSVGKALTSFNRAIEVVNETVVD